MCEYLAAQNTEHVRKRLTLLYKGARKVANVLLYAHMFAFDLVRCLNHIHVVAKIHKSTVNRRMEFMSCVNLKRH